MHLTTVDKFSCCGWILSLTGNNHHFKPTYVTNTVAEMFVCLTAPQIWHYNFPYHSRRNTHNAHLPDPVLFLSTKRLYTKCLDTCTQSVKSLSSVDRLLNTSTVLAILIYQSKLYQILPDGKLYVFPKITTGPSTVGNASDVTKFS